MIVISKRKRSWALLILYVFERIYWIKLYKSAHKTPILMYIVLCASKFYHISFLWLFSFIYQYKVLVFEVNRIFEFHLFFRSCVVINALSHKSIHWDFCKLLSVIIPYKTFIWYRKSFFFVLVSPSFPLLLLVIIFVTCSIWQFY